jgi:CPA2 family monovalent cation:H+ antiporter-2
MLAVTVPPLVAELAVVVLGAAAVSYLCTRIGLVPIVGFVLAGAAVGPSALGIVDNVELVEQTAEIGVIFLLFGIGLELSADRLRSLGALLFGGGAIQVVLTIALVAAGCLAFGVDTNTAIYTGCLISLSSTAIVLKLLSDRRQTGSPVGEVAVAVLIFQDLAVVVMVLVVPLLAPGASGGIGEIGGALLRSLIVALFVIGATQWFVPRALDKVAENSTDEVFLLSVAGFALVVAYAASLVGLTDSLGAFIAGLVISSSRHRERALRYITPFQMLFSAVFFASVGMLLNIGFVIDRWQLVLALAAGTVLAKAVATGVAAKVFRRPGPVIATSALLLAQVGEFSFVLQQNGQAAGLSPAGAGEDGSQAFIATAVLLFVLTPVLDFGGRRAGDWLQRRAVARGDAPPVPPTPAVVVVGGSEGTRALLGSAIEQSGLDFPVVNLDETTSERALQAMSGEETRLVVVVDPTSRELDELMSARPGDDGVPILTWVRDPEVARRVDTLDGVTAIDATAASEMTITRATLDALGVEQGRRLTALTRAVESLPAELRRPLA